MDLKTFITAIMCFWYLWIIIDIIYLIKRNPRTDWLSATLIFMFNTAAFIIIIYGIWAGNQITDRGSIL